MKKLNSVEQFEETVASEGTFFIIKHSTTCPISKAAYEEYEKFASENADIPTYYLTVQDARPLSNHIAERFHIKHESPQAILFVNSDLAWHDSHWKITNSALDRALAENKK